MTTAEKIENQAWFRMGAVLYNGTTIVSTMAPTQEDAIAWLDSMIDARRIKAYISIKPSAFDKLQNEQRVQAQRVQRVKPEITHSDYTTIGEYEDDTRYDDRDEQF